MYHNKNRTVQTRLKFLKPVCIQIEGHKGQHLSITEETQVAPLNTIGSNK